MDKKYWIQKCTTTGFVTLVFHAIGYLAIYPEVCNISSHELSSFDMYRNAYWITFIIAAGLAVTLVKVFGLTLNWKTYEEENDAA